MDSHISGHWYRLGHPHTAGVCSGEWARLWTSLEFQNDLLVLTSVATSGGGPGYYSGDRPTLESPIKTYSKMFVILSGTTLILISRSNSNCKWLKPPVEVVDFTIDELTSQLHRAFISSPMASIVLGLCSRSIRLLI
ncbi:unnamed protein product [Prunus armeniaca]